LASYPVQKGKRKASGEQRTTSENQYGRGLAGTMNPDRTDGLTGLRRRHLWRETWDGRARCARKQKGQWSDL